MFANGLPCTDYVLRLTSTRQQNANSDLTTIFPGVSNIKVSRRKGSNSQRSQLAAYVKGLGDFDEPAWRATNEKLGEGQELTPDVITTILRDLPLPDRDVHFVESWVENLGSRGHSQAHLRTKINSEVAKAPATDTQDDAFERMDTPPHVLKRNATDKAAGPRESVPPTAHPAQTGEDSETEDEDEDCLDIPPTTSQQQAVSTIEQTDYLEERQKTIRFNEFSRPELDEETERPISSPPVSKAQVKPDLDDTESEPESNPEKKPRKVGLAKFGGATPKKVSQEEEPKQAPAKPKGNIGMFGGKKVQPTAQPTSSAPSSSKPRSMLGRFGGKPKSVLAKQSVEQGEQNAEPNPSTGGGNAKLSTTPSRKIVSDVVEQAPERELTEEEKQQRADEKREQLKRELDGKAKTPAKKKRKF